MTMKERYISMMNQGRKEKIIEEKHCRKERKRTRPNNKEKEENEQTV